MSLSLALLGLAQAAAAQPATVAQAGTTEFEVQCMVALNQAAAQSQEAEAQSALSTAALFYTARVDRLAGNDQQLTQAVTGALNGMAGKQLGPIVQACGNHMNERLGRFQQLAAQAEAQGN